MAQKFRRKGVVIQMKEIPETDRFVTKPLLVIFLTILIDLIGFGIVIPLLPFYAAEFDASPFDVGVLVAVYSLMQFIFSPILGSLSDRYGRRPILLISIAGSAIGYMTIGMAGSLAVVFLGRIIGGITAGNLSTAQAYIADVTSRENRARGMGLFGMAFGFGFILGPALAGILGQFGADIPFFFAAGLATLNTVLIFIFLPETVTASDSHQPRSRNRFKELAASFKKPKLATINLQYFLLIVAFSMMTTAFPYFTQFNYEYTVKETGYVLAYVGLIAVFMQGVIFGRLANRFGESKLILAGCIILVVSLAAVPFVTSEAVGLIGLLIGTGFFAAGNSLASPSLTNLASKSSSDADQGTVMGVMQSGASLARVVGPAICGVLLNNANNKVDAATIRQNFWTAAAIMLVAGIVSVYYHFKFESDSTDII
jgi:DHA1 family tetracycline resistance protein-like MFS transporter